MPLPALTYTREGKTYTKPRLQRIEEVLIRAFLGQKQKDICRELGYTASRVSLIINSDYGQEYLRELRRQQETNAVDIVGKLRDQFVNHINLPEEILDNDDVPLKQKWKTFTDLGGMIGMGPSTKINIHTTQEITADELLEIKRRARHTSCEAEYEEVDEVDTSQDVSILCEERASHDE